jgi:predicted MPP superfamily phosphohydrolase
MQKSRLLWWKLVAVWVGFLLLHFSYGAFPGIVFRVLAEDHEATFFHMKMLFVSYAMVSLVELLVRRAAIKSRANFLYSRALIAVAYPWLT